jgi:hypothetical protein
MFVDDRLDEVLRQWQESGCEKQHRLLPLEPFDSIERVSELVQKHQPDVIVIGFGLNRYPITGADVIRTLREQRYEGYVIANSGGGVKLFSEAGVDVSGSTDRSGRKFREILETIFLKG